MSVSFFGDGATEEGHFHESLNLAGLYRLPVIFVCENNFYASHMALRERRVADNIVRSAEAHGIAGVALDGNDVLAVYEAATAAAVRARAGEGPSLIECRTYRWRGHVGPSWDMDVGVKRRDELADWKAKDPIVRAAALLSDRGWSDAQLREISAAAAAEVDGSRGGRAIGAVSGCQRAAYACVSRRRGRSLGMRTLSYAQALREAHAQLLASDPDVFVLGQGLWSPWYVGSSMADLDKEFGRDRILDSPVSENATTGAAVGAALAGMRPIVVHPRMDFMLLAVDPIVNQGANWCYMFAGQIACPVVIRAIINRGGEQAAQHSQALHAMFATFPG